MNKINLKYIKNRISNLKIAMNKINLKYIKNRISNLKIAILAMLIGTVAGLVTYYLFLILHIDIYGWNLGLVFAPLIAGYIETIIANKYIGESIGAISAFILFIVTVIYGFIIANPLLGFNVITIGSILIILQASLPTLINYILFVVVIGTISYILGIFKSITDYSYIILRKTYYKLRKREMPPILDTTTKYNEHLSNIKINNLDFVFLSITHPKHRVEEYKGIYEGKVILPKKLIISRNFKEKEENLLEKLKQGKDQALLNLSNSIKIDGGNGVIDLTIEYDLVGYRRDSFQIVARGTGVKLSD
jgi:uncharacterized protein YbjQ (UPF0145 family)